MAQDSSASTLGVSKGRRTFHVSLKDLGIKSASLRMKGKMVVSPRARLAECNGIARGTRKASLQALGPAMSLTCRGLQVNPKTSGRLDIKAPFLAQTLRGLEIGGLLSIKDLDLHFSTNEDPGSVATPGCVFQQDGLIGRKCPLV